MLTGLGRHLRRCGVDVTLLNDGDSHDLAAEVCRNSIRLNDILRHSYLKQFSLERIVDQVNNRDAAHEKRPNLRNGVISMVI